MAPPRDVFLDAASGAPQHPVARQALLAAMSDGWADPARLYSSARRARLLLDAAVEAVADSIGARPDEVSFAANGTAALHAAVLGTLRGDAGKTTFVHSAVEHSAVLHAAERYATERHATERHAAERYATEVHAAAHTVVSIGVDRLGRVDAAAFRHALRENNVAAGALQAANHEVGTTQPMDELDSPVPLIVDATQTLGHAALPRQWSVLAADARMWGGPSIGILAVRTGTRWRSPYPADDRGRLPGLPDLPAAVSAAAALRAVLAEREDVSSRQHTLIDRIRTVVAQLADVEVLGDPINRLPHIVTFSCLYADGEALLTALDRRGFAVSSGSSCTSDTLEPSHVLVAMGALTGGNVRVSLHRDTTDADVDEFLAALPMVLADVRAELGATNL